LGWDGFRGFRGFEKRGRFIEIEDIARLKVEPVADADGDGDLAFRSKRCLHEYICKPRK